ncbi:hypothetical protein OS493_003536 [Desmophyllum pertusum]|uniref:Uncharacterized protein n=1 Tax=Desmophyllum pertusum TaxID=174260 RepID=A0A9X0DDC3_9CNID|nr:hypothetical protein OS493_003536 [Desmophyllum pertusum]
MSERVDSPTGKTAKENCHRGIRNEEVNLEKLRTFSRSLENITAETLYSKWKRARGESPSKSARRARSVSLTTPPCFTREELKDQPSKPARKNSFHVLQENVFRPRSWTIAASPMEVIREHNAMHSLDINNNTMALNRQDTTSQWAQRRRKLGKQFTVTLEIPHKQHSPPPQAYEREKEQSQEQRHQGDGKQVAKTTSETFIKPSQKLRRVSEAAREDEDPPIVARLVSEEDEASMMADPVAKKPLSNLFVEMVKIEIPRQSVSMPASPNFLMRHHEHAWDTVDSANEPTGGPSSPLVKNPSEMTANNERSKPSQNTFSLGCTYAVVSQPSPPKDNSVKPIAKMNSAVISQEQRAELEAQFKKLKKVSLELDRAEFEEGRSTKPYNFSEARTKDTLESQPLRRFSELINTASRTSSGRPTARAILQNITNVAHKTEKQRIQDIEKAFEWIRKELAELRAQDKDIMRTFTKIQAGIRKIKLQRALSGALDEPYEYDIVDHSIDLSASFSYVPLVKEFHNTFPRRASLI